MESGKDIKLKATGDLTIEAVNIKLTPSANFTVSAGGCSIEAGSGSAKISAPMASVEGSGQTTIKGGIVMIN